MSTCEFGTKFDMIFNMVSLRISTCEFGTKLDMIFNMDECLLVNLVQRSKFDIKRYSIWYTLRIIKYL